MAKTIFRQGANRIIPISTAALLLAMSSLAFCCSIPVFRYALEHWHPEPYVVHVLVDDAPTEADRAAIDFLVASTKTTNLRVETIERGKSNVKGDDPLWNRPAGQKTPFMIVEAPHRWDPSRNLVLEEPLSIDSVKRLLDSPIRQRIANRLADVDSATWIFLDGKDAKENDERYSLLDSELQRLEKTIKLPTIDEADLKDLSKKPEELKLRFSLHRIAREQTEESSFVALLLATEADLRQEFEQGTPLAFPIFGRGRVLYALVGKGITTSTIEEASRFLAGACQCTVKAENPGVDMLMQFDWNSRVQITEPKKEDVQLIGLSDFAPPTKASATSLPGDATNVAESQTESNATKIESPKEGLPSGAESASPLPSPNLASQGNKEVGVAVLDEDQDEVVSREFVLGSSAMIFTLAGLILFVVLLTVGWMFTMGGKG